MCVFLFLFFAVTSLLASTAYFTFLCFYFLFFTLLPWEGVQGGNPGIKRKGRFFFESRPERLPKVTAKEIKIKIINTKVKYTVLARSVIILLWRFLCFGFYFFYCCYLTLILFF